MKTCLLCLILVFSVISISAKELDSWVENSAKVKTFEFFVDWMEKDHFYKINTIISEEVLNFENTLVQQTSIVFEDVTSCKGRRMITQCKPIEAKRELNCKFVKTHCK
ncbi:MAG: hypothetical protein AB8E15_05935 [Bdellovibrionales bacterium]